MIDLKYISGRLLVLIHLCFLCSIANSQWSHRYCKVDGFGHHVYLEGFELPVLNSGPTDPAPAPDGITIAFAAKGYLWLLNTQTNKAKRITSSGGIDSNPNWSPDGNKLVFVRDTGRDTEIVLLDLNENKEELLVNSKALELDPIFNSDGKSVYYSSADIGSLDLWNINIENKEATVIAKEKYLERLPIPFNTKNQILYLKKSGFSFDSVELLDLDSGSSKPIIEDNFTSQVSFTLSPDDRTLAYVFPHIDNYELRLKDVETSSSTMLLSKSNGLPLCPKFSADGQWIYFYENNKNESSEIKKISVNGGEIVKIKIDSWDWGQAHTKITLKSTINGKPAAVRLNIIDENGHPLFPDDRVVRTEGQNAKVFFYSAGEVELEVPYGALSVTAVQGFETAEINETFQIEEDGTHEFTIDLKRIWDASANGWFSGDTHFHLNYGGVYRLDPEDIILDLKGEGLDIGFPLLANLHNRFLEQGLWGWKNDSAPFISFGQEVRSHFLGHIGLIGVQELFWPWVWGPMYDIYGRDDRPNKDPLDFCKNQGGLGAYVHPVRVLNPFTKEGAARVPIGLVADCVLEKADLIELACLWTSEIGTASLWHEILNLGIPLAISGGSDVMNDYYRTMAVGVCRVYVNLEEEMSEERFLSSLKNGKSFVSTGPMIDFKIDGKKPGEALITKKDQIKFTMDVHSPTAYDKVEVFVNGVVIWTKEGQRNGGSHTYKGKITLPTGGWITARVSGGKASWPVMSTYPFAETSPIWIKEVGSVEPSVQKEAARKLLYVLNVSELDLKEGYGEVPIPILLEHFAEARKRLVDIIED